jgi:hypothetical protein
MNYGDGAEMRSSRVALAGAPQNCRSFSSYGTIMVPMVPMVPFLVVSSFGIFRQVAIAKSLHLQHATQSMRGNNKLTNNK